MPLNLKQSPRVVLAHADERSNVALHAMLTGWGYDVMIAANGVEAWQLLRSEDIPCLALLDWDLPALDGVDVCRRIHGGDHCNYVYTILLTGPRPVEELLDAMELGADDYVTKPFHAHELRARVRVGARIVQLQERLVQARAELYEKTTRDALTGIWNRAAAIDILDSELARASRAKAPLAVVMADLDSMKQFNAEFGHRAGDAVLREAAQRMNKTLRKYDSMGRYGGEEFLIVLPNCPYDASLAVAERVRRAASAGPYAIDGETHWVSCSLGVAWAGASDTDASALLRAADDALNAAKRNGRNRVESRLAAVGQARGAAVHYCVSA